jgi:hypothetical protein
MRAMAICWSCGRVKGKRACPARGGELICSRCCGTKRRVEIHCPEDCAYLRGADAQWTSESQQKDEARFLSHFLDLDERRAGFAIFFHHLIFQAARPIAALADDELASVLETASKTLETRGKGVLYSHQASSPHLQPLADWLVKVLSERGSIPGAPEATDAEVVAALNATLAAARDHAAEGSGRDRYLDLAARVLGEALRHGPRIELPEALAPLAPTSGGGLILPP